jgi:7-cyano-7-deazaguanine synthase in queuosine biosynthesis
MNGVFIRPKNEEELEFVSALLKKLGINSKVMSTEELEDIGLSKLMKTVDRTKKVSRANVMKKLKG